MPTALVILHPRGGAPQSAVSAATAARVREMLPDPEDAERVMAWFCARGFRVEAPFASSFSIVGTSAAFHDTFGTVPTDPGRLEAEELPGDIAQLVSEIVVPEAPAFSSDE
jgi:hypothetical protein